MSTRAMIYFTSEEIKEDEIITKHKMVGVMQRAETAIYVHHDGYPRGQFGIVERIKPFLALFQQRRGVADATYCAAWTLHHLISLAVEQNKKARADMTGASSLPKDGIDCLGFGIVGKDYCCGDAAYEYVVSPSGLFIISEGDGVSVEKF